MTAVLAVVLAVLIIRDLGASRVRRFLAVAALAAAALLASHGYAVAVGGLVLATVAGTLTVVLLLARTVVAGGAR